MSDDIVGTFHLRGIEDPSEVENLTDESAATIAEIARHGFGFSGQKGETLYFTKPNSSDFFNASVDICDAPEVASSLKSGILEHDDLQAIFDKQSGVYEFAVRSTARPLSRYRWGQPDKACAHDYKGDEEGYSFHLTGQDGAACIELSPATPLAAFLFSVQIISRGNAKRSRAYTVKVFNDSNEGANGALGLEGARDLVDRLLFELDATHGIHATTIPRVRRLVRIPSSRRPEAPMVRFPKVQVPREVSALFSFAGEAADNPPFMFLAYYQVLEYYLPHAASRGGLKAIRRELRALGFDDKSDASVLRVLNSIERNKNSNEEDQLKTLVSECVRGDVLHEFITSDDNSKHFSKSGPQLSVPPINSKSTSETLAVQVARRTYALRNRIVHAKDNPRYAESSVLLPRSREAGLLAPDIRLVRLLAIETVVDNQG
ncbi:hypothetical protein [Streptomyces sp. NPDC088746]|uniref:hypothetical protein n=1 Tax=Streptomyces sp. NPDC088746 TaxID=3365885 RepID=UPI0038278E5F